jgi:hypothetical protein
MAKSRIFNIAPMGYNYILSIYKHFTFIGTEYYNLYN